MSNDLLGEETPVQAAESGAQELRLASGDTCNVEAIYYSEDEPGGYYVDSHADAEEITDVIFQYLRQWYCREDDTDAEISEDFLEGADRLTVAACCCRKWLRMGPEPEDDEEGQILIFLDEQEPDTDPVTVVYLNDLYSIVVAGKTRAEVDSAEGDPAIS